MGAVFIIIFSAIGTPVSAMFPMDSMNHSNMDIVSCTNQHQVATPTATKELEQLENEDDTTPQELPYNFNQTDNYSELKKRKTILISSSSFRPPDIVILTSNLRI